MRSRANEAGVVSSVAVSDQHGSSPLPTSLLSIFDSDQTSICKLHTIIYILLKNQTCIETDIFKVSLTLKILWKIRDFTATISYVNCRVLLYKNVETFRILIASMSEFIEIISALNITVI